MCDKSNKHTTIYDSYNIKMASKKVKSVRLTNFIEIYSLANERKCDIDNLMQKHLFYKQFVAWSCSVSRVAALTYYINNLIYQVLISEGDYFDVLSDERICLDIRASSGYVKEAEKFEQNDSKITLHILLEEATTKELRLRV